MGGSRKGERRGGANPNRVRKPASAAPRARLSKPKHPPSFQSDPILRNVAMAPLNGMDKEQQVRLYNIASGQNVALPRDVMLDAMRYFQQIASEYHFVMQANMELAGREKDATKKAIYEQAVIGAERQVRENILLASDIAARCAPFMHARLAAIMTGNNPNGGSENPFNVLGMLMKDLDEAGRPPRFIEHDPDEVQNG